MLTIACVGVGVEGVAVMALGVVPTAVVFKDEAAVVVTTVVIPSFTAAAVAAVVTTCDT